MLPTDTVGVESLRRRLSALLLDHIRSELPSLCTEVEERLQLCEKDLKCIGDEQSSSRDQTASMKSTESVGILKYIL